MPKCRRKEAALSTAARGAAAALLVLFTAGTAQAQAPQLDLTHLRPSSGGDGLLGTEGARPLAEGDPALELKLTLDGAIHPLVFVGDNGGKQVLVKSRFGGWLTAGLHLTGPLSLAAQLTTTLGQVGDLSGLPPSARGPSSLAGGLGDLRLTPRLGLLRQESSKLLDLAVQASLTLPTASRQSMAGDGSVQGELLVAAARRLPLSTAMQLELLGNLYGRIRPKQQFLDVKTGSELGLRAGAAVLLQAESRLVPRRLFAELEGQSWLRGGLGGSSPAEWRLGASFCALRGLALEGGAGGGLGHGIGAPVARFVFAASFAPGTCGAQSAPVDKQEPVTTVAMSAPPPAKIAETPPAEAKVLANEPKVVPAEPKGTGAETGSAPLEPPAAGAKTEPAQAVTPPAAAPAPPPDLMAIPLPQLPPPAPPPALPDLPVAPPPTALAQAEPLVKLGEDKLDILETVRFKPSKAAIDRASFALLDQVARVLKDHPELTLVQVEGHTDNQGAPAKNRKLSQARAAAVVKYLVSHGVERSRLRAKGLGADAPLAPNNTARNREKNRRVEFKIVERKQSGPSSAG